MYIATLKQGIDNVQLLSNRVYESKSTILLMMSFNRQDVSLRTIPFTQTNFSHSILRISYEGILSAHIFYIDI